MVSTLIKAHHLLASMFDLLLVLNNDYFSSTLGFFHELILNNKSPCCCLDIHIHQSCIMKAINNRLVMCQFSNVLLAIDKAHTVTNTGPCTADPT